MRKYVDRRIPLGFPDKKADSRGAQAAKGPEKTLHTHALLFVHFGGRCCLYPWMQRKPLASTRTVPGFCGSSAGGYTLQMDRVRFGRALGLGARQTMKTLLTAVDAATAENPTRTAVPPRATPVGASPRRPEVERPVAAAASAGRTADAKLRQVHGGVRRGSRRFGEAVWNPFVRLSGVLWLEVTGVFFGILALFAAQGVWKAHEEWRAGGPHQHLFGAAAMLAVFGYFCISSFVRAYRRERRR